ncbi:MAG: CocE/NonD family hydrolase [Dongiaceae bacterium]
MKHVDTFPHAIELRDPVWIAMPDGCRLAARIWLPADADARPVPAILEYIPYRRHDFTAIGDSLQHRYLAGHGYAAVRVDMRGSGDSEGILVDEYLPQELADGAAVIAWLAAQPWCSGAVGMMGISWGGFNALQVAALRPPALRAIVTVASTDDRYADDMHAMGGCRLTDEMIWASTMFGFNSRPPDPAVAGPGWRAQWLERLERSRPWIVEWLGHQARDGFFRHGSVCEDYAAIECAVYAVGGWADGYSNAIPRLLAGLPGPRKGLIGPWGHAYPHLGKPGPAIGWLQEQLRWWDHWLKGVDTGIMDEPMLRAWLQEPVPPQAQYELRPGRWVAEPAWPAPAIEPRRLALAPGRLGGDGAAATLLHDTPATVGMAGGEWCPYGYDSEMPLDQRADDAGSLVFDSEPLAERLEILGAPEAELTLAVDRPFAFVVVRLVDVAPGGAATRVTYGALNLRFRDGFAAGRPVPVGEPITVTVRLNDIGHAFAAGHRIRLAVSTAYWPVIWPSPSPVRLTLHPGGGGLRLPVRRPRPEDESLPPFAAPEAAAPVAHTRIAPYGRSRRVVHDVASGETVVEAVKDRGRFLLHDTGVTYAGKGVDRFVLTGDDPLSARIESSYAIELAGPGWATRTEARTAVTGTATHFLVTASLEAWEGATRIFARTYDAAVPRTEI